MTLTAADTAELVAADLAAPRQWLRWITEADLQDELWKVLSRRREWACWRESSLPPRLGFAPIGRDRPDFLVKIGTPKVAVEVKIKGARSAILRQLGRYAEHDEVDGIVFASGRRTLVAGMPDEIHGKPVRSVFVGWGPL